MNELGIVGTGRLAKAFLSFLTSQGHSVSGIWGRNPTNTTILSNTFNVKAFKTLEEIRSDWVIVCVSDEAIDEIVIQLRNTQRVSITSAVFDINKFHNTSLLYPLQSFDDSTISEFKKIPIILDGNTDDINFLKEICNQWELKSYQMNLIKRKQLHTTAVFFNNFTHHILHKGTQLANQFKIDKNLFKELINNTFKRIDLNNMFNLQTGPAFREDHATMEQHKELLTEEFLSLYIHLSESIIKNKHELQGKIK